jgi:hypothetical protein
MRFAVQQQRLIAARSQFYLPPLANGVQNLHRFVDWTQTLDRPAKTATKSGMHSSRGRRDPLTQSQALDCDISSIKRMAGGAKRHSESKSL